MARGFGATSTQGFNFEIPSIAGGLGVSPDQFTMAGWIYVNSTISANATFFQNFSVAGGGINQLVWRQSTQLLRLRVRTGGTQVNLDCPIATAGGKDTWIHFCWRFIFSSPGLHFNEVYYNGEICAVFGTSPGTDFDIFWSYGKGLFTQSIDGRMAEWAMWDSALSRDHILAMPRGVSPARLFPTDNYVPMAFAGDAEPDWSPRSNLITGTDLPTVEDHPPIAAGGRFGLNRTWRHEQPRVFCVVDQVSNAVLHADEDAGNAVLHADEDAGNSLLNADEDAGDVFFGEDCN